MRQSRKFSVVGVMDATKPRASVKSGYTTSFDHLSFSSNLAAAVSAGEFLLRSEGDAPASAVWLCAGNARQVKLVKHEFNLSDALSKWQFFDSS